MVIQNTQIPFIRIPIRGVILSVLILLTQTAFGQQTLIIKGNSDVEIKLTGDLKILSDGKVEATPEEPNSCQSAQSCAGVDVKVVGFSSDKASNGVVSVPEGESVVLDWRSLGATSCSAGGTYSAWSGRGALPTDARDASSSQVALSTAVGDAAGSPFQLTLDCSTGSVASADLMQSGSLQLEITKVVQPSPTDCTGRDPIPGWTRLTTGSRSCRYDFGLDRNADCRKWSPNLWGSPFLQSAGLPQDLLTNVTDERQYVAIEFSTSGLKSTAWGQLSIEGASPGIRVERVLATISQCPGDFNPNQVTGCYLTPGSFFPFRWKAPGSAEATKCVLQPDKIYYLNMLATESPLGTQPAEIQPITACDTERCGVLLTPRIYGQ